MVVFVFREKVGVKEEELRKGHLPDCKKKALRICCI
jgi:hypothetical protein